VSAYSSLTVRRDEGVDSKREDGGWELVLEESLEAAGEESPAGGEWRDINGSLLP